MNQGLSKREQVEVACGCGHVQRVERWPLIDEAEFPEKVADLASRMPDPGRCSACGAELPQLDFFAVLRHCRAGAIYFVFSTGPNTLVPPHDEWSGTTKAMRTIRLPFESAPVVLSRDLQADLENRPTAIAEVNDAFDSDTAHNYTRLLAEVGRIEADKRSGELIESLANVASAEQFKQILAENSALLGDGVLEYLDRVGAMEGFRASVEVTASLLREARSDPDLAWRRYRDQLSKVERAGDQIEEAMKALEKLHAEERWEEAVATARPALEEAQRLGYGIAVGMIHAQLGVALLRSPGGDRRADIEEAIEHLRLASHAAPSRQIRAAQLVNLAGAYGQRLTGDPNENFEEALRLLERAAGQLDRESEPREWSTLQTNLCRSLQVRESGEKVANLEQALQHCEAALQVRSPEIDAEDWAYSQINLGVTLQLLAERGVRDIAEARDAYETILGKQAQLPRTWMKAQVLGALADINRTAARSAGEADDTTAQARHLHSARRYLRGALELIDPTEHRPLYARLLNHLSDVLDMLGDSQAAVEACEQALNLLTPQGAPVEYQEVAWRLGALLTASADWDLAADAYRQALAAAEITFHARLHTVGRKAEMRRQGNLARWAAYAVARSGNAKEAVLILEGGRARELGRRLAGEGLDPADLDGLSDELADAFIAATGALKSAALGDDSSGASRAVQEILGEIRQQPGFEHFAKAAGWEQILAAAEPGWPLVYLNPTPGGTVFLFVEIDEHGGAQVESIFRDTPRGTDVAAAMLLGGDVKGGNGHSYVGTASGMTPDRDLGIALEALLPWLGTEFGSHVDAYLRRTGAVGATLVPCGLIGLAPIHVGTWREGGKQKSLIEGFAIRYAPSASMQATSLVRRGKAEARPPPVGRARQSNRRRPRGRRGRGRGNRGDLWRPSCESRDRSCCDERLSPRPCRRGDPSSSRLSCQRGGLRSRPELGRALRPQRGCDRVGRGGAAES